MKISQNFLLQEFVPKDVYDLWGQRSVQFLDFRIVEFAQLLRNSLGRALVINNWHRGGKFSESGLRPFQTRTGSKMSQHKFGRAIDVKLIDLNGDVEKDCGELLRKHVQDNWALYDRFITTTEADTDTWAHFDCRYTGTASLTFVSNPNPPKKS